MRRHRSDANQKEIVKALRAIGCTVYIIGRPVDLVVGYRGRNFLLDVKAATGKKTEFQREFFRDWRGQVRIARSVEDAINLVTKAYQSEGTGER